MAEGIPFMQNKRLRICAIFLIVLINMIKLFLTPVQYQK